MIDIIHNRLILSHIYHLLVFLIVRKNTTIKRLQPGFITDFINI